MPRVLCTSLNAPVGPHVDLLTAAGYEVVSPPDYQALVRPEVLIEQARGCCGVVAGSEPWPRAVLAALPELRVLARTGVGYDAIDMAACDDLRIVVATTPGVNHHAVAEHTLALLYGVARGFPARDQFVRAAAWKRFSTPRVMGCTLGIVGLGRIGRAVATRAAGLGLKLLAYDPYPPDEFAEQWAVTMTSLDELFAQSDYVTLHLPVTAETKHLINRQTLAQMKAGAVLINTARGALVDEVALVEALQSGHLRGAGLDVFEVEPLPATSPLLKLDNVLLSGHLAGLDDESQHGTLTMSADTILQLANGKWPTERIRNLAGIRDWTWASR